MNEELAVYEAPMTPGEVIAQVDCIQGVMKAVMRENEHYGKIPGCGDKPALLKAGAEKLNLAFRMEPSFDITTIDYDRGHREYRITCNMNSVLTGRRLGSGVGSACTLETKWRYRLGPVEFTGREVPKEYWNLRKTDPQKALEMIGGKGFSTRKNDAGTWEIVKQGERVEHDNPADVWNTVLKMAKKRALVDAVLTVTAASDIFTQDIEEMVDETPPTQTKPKPEVKEPQRKSDQPKISLEELKARILEITDKLVELTGKNPKSLLEEVSYFKTDQGKEFRASSLEELFKPNKQGEVKWAYTAYGKLQKMLEELQPKESA